MKRVHICIICKMTDICIDELNDDLGIDASERKEFCDFREHIKMHGECMAKIVGHHGIIEEDEFNRALIKRGIITEWKK